MFRAFFKSANQVCNHLYFNLINVEIARDFQSLTINKLLYGNETLDYQLYIELFSVVHRGYSNFWNEYAIYFIE